MTTARVGQPVKDRDFLTGVSRQGSELTVALRREVLFASVVIGGDGYGRLSVARFGGRSPQLTIPYQDRYFIPDEVAVFAAKTNEVRLRKGPEFLILDARNWVLISAELLATEYRGRHLGQPHISARVQFGESKQGEREFWSLTGGIEQASHTTVRVTVSDSMEEALKVVERSYDGGLTNEPVSRATFTNIGTFRLTPATAAQTEASDPLSGK